MKLTIWFVVCDKISLYDILIKGNYLKSPGLRISQRPDLRNKVKRPPLGQTSMIISIEFLIVNVPCC